MLLNIFFAFQTKAKTYDEKSYDHATLRKTFGLFILK